MKQEIHSILEVDDEHSRLSKLYNVLNIVFTIVSLIPLIFHEQTPILFYIEAISVGFFVIDYILRWLTADIEFPNRPAWLAYLIYPFTIYAILDLLAILPFLTLLNQTWRLVRLFRLIRSLRIFRAFRVFRYSQSVSLLIDTIKKQRDSLVIVGGLTIIYIVFAAVLVFNFEPQTFPSFLDALFWSTSSLTAVTYGDLYPKSDIGQVLAMFSYIIGVVIIALPSSIITAGYIEEMNKAKRKDQTKDNDDNDESTE